MLRAAAGNAGGGAPAWSPLDIEGIQSWFDFTDPTVLFTDDGVTAVTADGDSVYRCSDQVNGHHLKQTSAGSRPLYKVNILNGRSVARFDGTDDYMQTATFGDALVQPYTVVLVFKYTTSVFGSSVFDGLTANRGNLIHWSGDEWMLAAGNGPQPTSQAVSTTGFHYVTALFNGASSKFRYDGALTAGTPNAGTSSVTGWTLGSDLNGGDAFAGDVAEAILVAQAITAPDLALLDTYIDERYGL